MKLLLATGCIAVLFLGAPAYSWDDPYDSGYGSGHARDGWSNDDPYERKEPPARFDWDRDDDDTPRRKARDDSLYGGYSNPYERPKERSLFYETPTRREDRVRTITPSEPIEPFRPWENQPKPPKGSGGHAIMRQFEQVR